MIHYQTVFMQKHVQRCERILFCTILCLEEFWSNLHIVASGTDLCTAPLHFHHNISVLLRSKLWLGHCKNLYSLTFQSFCCRFTSSLGFIVLLTQFWRSFTWREALTVNSSVLWWAEELVDMVDWITGRGTSPNYQASTTCLTIGKRCLCWYAMCLVFSKCVTVQWGLTFPLPSL